jgi:V8-like Glu-specific endopeptidase
LTARALLASPPDTTSTNPSKEHTVYLDYKNPDSIAKNTTLVMRELRSIRDMLRKGAKGAKGAKAAELTDEGLDVRLVANTDGELWFATGDVQYDTVHGAACTATTVSPNSDDDELSTSARELVEGVADQLADGEAV